MLLTKASLSPVKHKSYTIALTRCITCLDGGLQSVSRPGTPARNMQINESDVHPDIIQTQPLLWHINAHAGFLHHQPWLGTRGSLLLYFISISWWEYSPRNSCGMFIISKYTDMSFTAFLATLHLSFLNMKGVLMETSSSFPKLGKHAMHYFIKACHVVLNICMKITVFCPLCGW